MANQALINNNERELLRRIWLEANTTPTAFISLDTEYTHQGVCELGIATTQKHSHIRARHVVVNDSRRLKRTKPKPFQFGLSDEVQTEGELLPILVDALASLRAENQVVVLTGHDVQVEIRNLRKCCGWEVPNNVIVLDTQRIWRSWVNVPVRGNLQQALEFFNILCLKAHLHNAGNDAKYTMELLVRKASQAVACPAPMDRAHYGVPDPRPANAFVGSSQPHLQRHPNTPDLGDYGRKRKREAELAPEPSRHATSPEALSAQESDLRGIRKRRRLRRPSAMRPAAARQANMPLAAPVNDVEIIDLTDDEPPRSPPRQGPSGLRNDNPIDLTVDMPPPESVKPTWDFVSHNRVCKEPENDQHSRKPVQHKQEQELGLLAGQHAAVRGPARAVRAPGIPTLDAAMVGPIKKEQYEGMTGTLGDPSDNPVRETVEQGPEDTGFAGGPAPMKEKHEKSLLAGENVVAADSPSNPEESTVLDHPLDDADESAAQQHQRLQRELSCRLEDIILGS